MNIFELKRMFEDENVEIQFPVKVIDAMNKCRDMHMFKPKGYSPDIVKIRLDKYRKMISILSDVYGITAPKIELKEVSAQSWMRLGSASYDGNKMIFWGRIDMVTALHQFAHVLGLNDVGAIRYSTNLYRMIFCKSYEKYKNSRVRENETSTN